MFGSVPTFVALRCAPTEVGVDTEPSNQDNLCDTIQSKVVYNPAYFPRFCLLVGVVILVLYY